MSPATRAAVTSAGGQARAEKLTPAQRAESARNAARAAHSAPALARRLAAKWAELDEAERDEVRQIFAPVGLAGKTRRM